MMRSFTLYSNRLLIILFAVIVCIPASGLFIKKNNEEFRMLLNRDPYSFPPVKITSLGRTNFKGIENWFADAALGIPFLSKLSSNLIYQLGVSSKPGKAILGKNDWLFLGNDYAATIDQLTGKNRPTQEEIYLQLAALKQMKRVAQQHHIPFLVAIAPDKHDIYPEYLPSNIRRGSHKNRLELLEEQMAANQIEFVSLKQKELEAKKILTKQYGDIYLKGDSHWNMLGAYVAYQAIAERMIQHGLQINPLEYQFIPRTTTYTDLTHFLQLTHIQSNSPAPDVSTLKMDLIGKDINGVISLRSAFDGFPGIIENPYQITNKAVHNKQTCLLIGDSFSESMIFYFYNDFYNTVRIHPFAKWDLSELIKRYHPDVIVYEKVERDLIVPLNNFQVTSAQMNLKQSKQQVLTKAHIDKLKIEADKIIIKGWAYIPKENAGLSEVYIKLSNEKDTYTFSMNKELKHSIRLARKHEGKHLNLSGFSGIISRKNLPQGTYTISLLVQNKKIRGEKKLSQQLINDA